MFLRALALCAMLALGLNSAAAAATVYWLGADSPHRTQLAEAGFSVREFKDFSLAVGPSNFPDRDGLRHVETTHGHELYLFRLEHDEQLPQLAGVHELRRSNEFTLVELNEAAASNPLLGGHREALVYLERMHRDGLPQLRAKRSVDPDVKTGIVGAVEATELEARIRELSGADSFLLNGNSSSIADRYFSGDGIVLAANYLDDRLSSMGYSVLRQPFNVFGTDVENIIAVKTGQSAPSEIIVVGAHYDSVAGNGFAFPAPGAEDNGSGTAAVLHLADIFKDFDTERTIHFVLFSAEEQGLLGSQHYVQQALINGDNIVAALTMDMVGTYASRYQVQIEGWLATQGDAGSEALMNDVVANMAFAAPLSHNIYTPGFGSDHVPFHSAGIPAMLAIETDYNSYPGYHKTTDTVANMKSGFAIAADIARLMAASLADLATPIAGVSILVSGMQAELVEGRVVIRWHFAESHAVRALRVFRQRAGESAEQLGAALSPLAGGMAITDLAAGLQEGEQVLYALEVEYDDGERAVVAQAQIEYSRSADFAFRLGQNEPNPMHVGETTTIGFASEQNGELSLRIYDSAGRLIRNLYRGETAGARSVLWDGRDERGRPAPAGVYFYRLSQDGSVRTRRLTLLH